MSNCLLEVKNLVKHFPVKEGLLSREVARVHAVDNVSFNIEKGTTTSIVGESGCGKTTTARTLLNLIKPTSGAVIFKGSNIYDLPSDDLRSLRKDMQIIFQDPYESLNPRMTVEDIVAEGLIIHSSLSKDERSEKVSELLTKAGLSPSHMGRYPHEFSGGQRQRIGIARALSTNPDFIVCDEAVSALDVSIQAQIINLLIDLQKEMGLTYLFIAHDLSVVKHISDRVIVMYLGEIVEEADCNDLFNNPLHPYTKALLSSIPVPDPLKKSEKKTLTGELPSPTDPPAGCRFHTRCPFAEDRCKSGEIKVVEKDNNHKVKCILAENR
ncbi:MAG: ABC transporter ATP-binding protein [Planctomycetota bacterium]|jgi:oligopeptide transport system ATP-binding protein